MGRKVEMHVDIAQRTGILHGKWPEDDRVEQSEKRQVQADAHCEHEDRDNGKARFLAELSDCEDGIPEKIAYPVRAALVSAIFPNLTHPAEFDASASHRLSMRKPPALELSSETFQMKAQFGFQFRLVVLQCA